MRSTLMAAVAALTLCVPTFALSEDMANIMVMDPYARASTPTARSGAAFMQIMNHGEADRLISVASPVAKRAELHTHVEEDGVMRMTHVKDGFDVPAEGRLTLARGANHVMLMGLSERFDHGRMIELTLTFEKAGDVVVQLPVDLERKADHGGMVQGDMDHSGHGSGHGSN